jgi:hypothetical protein
VQSVDGTANEAPRVCATCFLVFGLVVRVCFVFSLKAMSFDLSSIIANGSVRTFKGKEGFVFFFFFFFFFFSSLFLQMPVAN